VFARHHRAAEAAAHRLEIPLEHAPVGVFQQADSRSAAAASGPSGLSIMVATTRSPLVRLRPGGVPKTRVNASRKPLWIRIRCRTSRRRAMCRAQPRECPPAGGPGTTRRNSSRGALETTDARSGEHQPTAAAALSL
jgi:hypothetical protein